MCVQTSHCCNHHQTQSYNATVSSLSRYLRIYTVSTVLLPPGFRQRAVRAGCSQLPSGQCPYHNANYSTPHHHCTTAAITTLIRHKFLFTWLTLWRPRHRYLTHIYISTYLHIYISTISAHPHARSQPRVVAQIRILDTWLWKVNNNVHFLFLSSRNLIFHIHVEVLCETQVSRARQNTLGLYFTHFADNNVLTFKIEHSTCKPAQPTILTLPSCTRTTALLSIKIHFYFWLPLIVHHVSRV